MSVVCLNLVVLRVQDMARSEEVYSLLGLSFVLHRYGAGPEHLSEITAPGVLRHGRSRVLPFLEGSCSGKVC